MKNWNFYSIPCPLITLLKLAFQFLNSEVCCYCCFYFWHMKTSTDAIKITLRYKLKAHKKNFLCVLSCLSCVWLFETPMDCSPPGSSVCGILQARRLEWIVIPFSGELPHPEIEPRSPALQADSLLSEPLRYKYKALKKNLLSWGHL